MRVGTGRIERRFELVDGRPRTTAAVVDGRAVPIHPDDQELALVVDGRRRTDADLAPSDVEADPAGRRLAWTLRGHGLTVRVVVEADDGAGVVRKRVEVTGGGRLDAVELERWREGAFTGFETTGEPVPYNAGAPGLGQPVFGPNFFAGVEHPVAENLVHPRGARALCRLALAVDLGATPYRPPPSVLGPGGLDDFWDYLDTLRPVPARLFTLTNNWYHLGATGLMDEAHVAAEVAGFAAVSARHDLPIDAVVLDDGWEGEWDDASGIWGRLAPSRFPGGLAALGPAMGLWLSPFGGYGGRAQDRFDWAAAHGLEVERAATGLCVAGAEYRAYLARVLADWTAAGVRYWKLDGVRFTCAHPDHGHPVGPGARTAMVDNFGDLVAGIRAVRPDVAVAFTIGSHPSPWWLAAVDFLWRGGLDDTEAERPGGRLERFDTYIDECLHTYRRSALPTSALVSFAVVEAPNASYRDPADLAGWERHCWLNVGRGTLHQDLYVAPDSLSDDEWAALARALHWARDHQRVLARSRMILGDPARGQIYGFAARRGDDVTACLRNPSAAEQAVAPDWPALLGADVDLHVVFGDGPAGATVALAPFAVVVMEGKVAAAAG